MDALAGSRIEVELAIVDQYSNRDSSEIEISVDCTTIIESLKLKRRRGEDDMTHLTPKPVPRFGSKRAVTLQPQSQEISHTNRRFPNLPRCFMWIREE